jgi:hypothetical protein
MRHYVISMLLATVVLAGCAAETSPEPIGGDRAGLQSPCMSDDDCGGGSCDTSECLSCCAPGEPCIAVCCGTCEGPTPGPTRCMRVICAAGYEPITDRFGCDHGCRPVAGTPCGPSRCGGGQVCCNESCGICTEPDGFCTQQICDSVAL